MAPGRGERRARRCAATLLTFPGTGFAWHRDPRRGRWEDGGWPRGARPSSSPGRGNPRPRRTSRPPGQTSASRLAGVGFQPVEPGSGERRLGSAGHTLRQAGAVAVAVPSRPPGCAVAQFSGRRAARSPRGRAGGGGGERSSARWSFGGGGWVRAWIFPLLRPNTSSKHPAPSITPHPQPQSAQCPVGQGRGGGGGGSAARGCAVTRGVCVCVFEGGRDPAGAHRAAGAQRDPQHPRLAAPPGD